MSSHRISPLLAALAAAALLAMLQSLLFPWIAVSLGHWPPLDSHLLTARLFANCGTNVTCAHATATLGFAAFAVAVAFIASRKTETPWIAASVAGVALALSPLGSVVLVHPFGAESFFSLLLFAVLLADVTQALSLPLPLKCAVAAALVLDDPLFILSALAYAAALAIYNEGRKAFAIALSAVAAGSAAALVAPGAMFAHRPIAGNGTGLTLIACAFLLCVAGPVLIAVFREGLPERIGFVNGNGVSFFVGVAALLQGLFASGNSPAAYWLAAQAAFLVTLVRAPRARSTAAIAVIGVTAILDLFQVLTFAHSGSFMAVAGVSRNIQTVSAALAGAHALGDTVCVSGADSAAFESAHTIYGSVHFVSEPLQCLPQSAPNTYVIAMNGENATNWGTGGNALMKAALPQRNRHAALPRGIATPASGRGVFWTSVDTPLGKVPAFVVQSGFSYTISCAWTGRHRHLKFAAANPLQAYPGATPVQYTVSASDGTRDRVLVQREVDPHAGPIDWVFSNVPLPQRNGCGKLTFSATALGPQAIGTWSEFVSPEVY